MDLHPNLINYYDTQVDKDFVYLAIEQCEGNLENLVDLMKLVKQKAAPESFEPMSLFKTFQRDIDYIITPDYIRAVLMQTL